MRSLVGIQPGPDSVSGAEVIDGSLEEIDLDPAAVTAIQNHTPQAHAIGGASHDVDTFANLQSKVSGGLLVNRTDTAQIIEPAAKRARISGGTTLLWGAINDGEVIKRSGSSLIGSPAKGYGSMLMEGNATDTVIASVDTWTKVAGTTVAGPLSDFTMPATNKLKYTGTNSFNALIMASWGVDRASGSGELEIELTLFKNGTKIANLTLSDSVTSFRDAGSLQTILALVQNDELEFYARNISDSTDIMFPDFQMSVVEI